MRRPGDAADGGSFFDLLSEAVECAIPATGESMERMAGRLEEMRRRFEGGAARLSVAELAELRRGLAHAGRLADHAALRRLGWARQLQALETGYTPGGALAPRPSSSSWECVG